MSQKTIIQQALLDQLRKPTKSGLGPERPYFDVFMGNLFNDALKSGRTQQWLGELLLGKNTIEDIDKQVNRSRREDLDFLAYRIHRLAFDVQQRVLLSQARDQAFMAGRRGGKSETIKLKSISTATGKPRGRALIIGLTVTKAHDIYWDGLTRILDDLGLEYTASLDDECITLWNESVIQLGGNANRAEREKYRGLHWDSIAVDECQSQGGLQDFCESVLRPMLIDTDGTLLLAGTGPRTRGTYWESIYTNPPPSGLRLNWNLSHNPHIPNHDEALAKIREARSLSESDPLYMREYLGQIVYDDDALVFRSSDENYFTWEEFKAWMESQSPEDIRFVAGLDYGFRDADALVVWCYSQKRNEKFAVWEYVNRETDVTTLVEKIKEARAFIATDPMFAWSKRRTFDIYADTNEQKITLELNARHGIIVHNALKYDKTMAVSNMREEVRMRRAKYLKGGLLDRDSLRIVFKRLDLEGQPSIITREIDEEEFHSDVWYAAIYALRAYWLTHAPDHAGESSPKPPPAPAMPVMNEPGKRRNTGRY